MKRNSSAARRRRGDYESEQRRRMLAAAMFRQGCSQAEVARRLEVSRQTASRWHAAFRLGGKDEPRGAGRTGRKLNLSGDQLCQLETIFLAGAPASSYSTDLWTLKRIAQVIGREFRVKFRVGHEWKVLGQLGWSC